MNLRHALTLLPLAGSLFACAHAERIEVDLSGQTPFTVVDIDDVNAYFIDPRTESCFLRLGRGTGSNLAAVPCDKLKRNVPEAARHITWGPDAAAPEKAVAAPATP
jgi:hypothetical protein